LLAARDHDEFFEVDGLRVRYRIRGEGPPLLLVQGIGASVELWGPLPELLDGFTTIAFDHPGAGLSDTPPQFVPMRQFARVAAEALAHLGYDEADVLGFSFGGMVAQELAHAFPELVRRLVLVATSCGWGGVPAGPAALAAIATPYRYYSPSYFQLVAPVLYGGTGDVARLQEQADVRRRHPPSVRGYYTQLLAAWSWSSLRWVNELSCPTLVLCGSDDPITPVVNSHILARELSHGELVEFPQGGHLFHVESAAEVAPRVLEFLTRDAR
jgi:pimeloyl-ACP methyl ester carboxylesterase